MNIQKVIDENEQERKKLNEELKQHISSSEQDKNIIKSLNTQLN